VQFFTDHISYNGAFIKDSNLYRIAY